MKNFEGLRIWQDARIFIGDIYKMMKDNKDYGFKDQLQRASISIMNILLKVLNRERLRNLNAIYKLQKQVVVK